LEYRIFSALRWTIFGEVFSRLISPILFVAIAKFLLPEDFGLVTSATIFLTFAQIFIESGVGRSLIQKKNEIEIYASTSLVFNIILSFTIYLFVLFFGKYIAKFLGVSSVERILPYVCIQVPLLAVASIYTSLYQRDFRFQSLSVYRLSSSLLTGVITLSLAFQKFGFWSLIIGNLLGQLVNLLFLIKNSKIQLSLNFDKSKFMEILPFGSWSTLTGMLGWFYAWMDSLMVSSYLTTTDLGIYRTGNLFVSMIFGAIFSSIMPVLYSYFSSLGKEDLEHKLKNTAKSIAFLSIPMGVGILILFHSIETLFFSFEWKGIGMVIGIMGLYQGLAWGVGGNGECYRALGKANLETKIMFIASLFYCVGYFLTIKYGLVYFLYSRLILLIFGISLQIYFANLYLKTNWTDWFKIYSTPMLSSLFMALSIFLLNKLIDFENIYLLILKIIFGVLVYASGSYLLDKPYFILMSQFVKKNIKRIN
jgi:O-antigen/teichoic acid export membrane protein